MAFEPSRLKRQPPPLAVVCLTLGHDPATVAFELQSVTFDARTVERRCLRLNRHPPRVEFECSTVERDAPTLAGERAALPRAAALPGGDEV